MNKQEKIKEILDRGVVNIIPGREALEKLLLSDKKLNVYLGIDPTATRIHLGNAVPIRRLQMFVELGHKVTFLIGDFTALIGDTSDKESERPVLSQEQINENFQTYKDQASKFLDFSKVDLKFNSEWLSKLNFAEIVKLMRHFSLNDFISRELIRKRLTEGKSVSLPEVIYPVMQGYDSYLLDTDIQIGASDQVFNMQAGRVLQKDLRSKESFIVENGYLPGTDGRKMSKSWNNGIWLTDTAEDIYGKVMSVKDEVIKDYLILGTSLPMKEVEEKIERLGKGENPMIIKRELARTIVQELHDETAVLRAEEYFNKTVIKKEAGEDTKEVKIEKSSLTMEEVIDLIVDNGLCESKSEARRLVKQGGVYRDDQRLSLESSLSIEKEVILRIGKRKYLRLVTV